MKILLYLTNSNAILCAFVLIGRSQNLFYKLRKHNYFYRFIEKICKMIEKIPNYIKIYIQAHINYIG